MSEEVSALDLCEARCRFYVYQLVDSRDGRAFYVGKGQGRRAWMHELAVRRGKVSNRAKTERIKSILASGSSVVVEILTRHEQEIDAYRAEVEKISEIGLSRLTNCNSGGTGSFSDRGQGETVINLNAAVDGAILLAGIEGETKAGWIQARGYSLGEGELWYGRITKVLRTVVAHCIDRYGRDRFDQFMTAKMARCGVSS